MHSTASDAFINSCLATITHLIPVSAGVFIWSIATCGRITTFCTACPIKRISNT